MQKYDSDTQQIELNRIYQVAFNLPGIVTKTWEFVSNCSPYYCTIKSVREEGGLAVAELSDVAIVMAIHTASRLCDDIILGDVTVVGETAIASQLAINSRYVRNETKREFTKYQAIISLLSRIVTDKSMEATESKALGNLTIDKKAFRKIEFGSLLLVLQRMLKFWETKLRNECNGGKTITSAVKGGSSSPFPLSSRVF